MNPIVEKVFTSKKPFTLTPSEIARADTSYSDNIIRYTIVRRLQSNGQYLCAAVNVDTGKVIEAEVAEDRADCRRAIKEVNRWLDKMGTGGPMSSKSRHREKRN